MPRGLACSATREDLFLEYAEMGQIPIERVRLLIAARLRSWQQDQQTAAEPGPLDDRAVDAALAALFGEHAAPWRVEGGVTASDFDEAFSKAPDLMEAFFANHKRDAMVANESDADSDVDVDEAIASMSAGSTMSGSPVGVLKGGRLDTAADGALITKRQLNFGEVHITAAQHATLNALFTACLEADMQYQGQLGEFSTEIHSNKIQAAGLARVLQDDDVGGELACSLRERLIGDPKRFVSAMLDRLDLDGDGGISFSEFVTAFESRVKSDGSTLQTDNTATAAELHAMTNEYFILRDDAEMREAELTDALRESEEQLRIAHIDAQERDVREDTYEDELADLRSQVLSARQERLRMVAQIQLLESSLDEAASQVSKLEGELDGARKQLSTRADSRVVSRRRMLPHAPSVRRLLPQTPGLPMQPSASCQCHEMAQKICELKQLNESLQQQVAQKSESSALISSPNLAQEQALQAAKLFCQKAHEENLAAFRELDKITAERTALRASNAELAQRLAVSEAKSTQLEMQMADQMEETTRQVQTLWGALDEAMEWKGEAERLQSEVIALSQNCNSVDPVGPLMHSALEDVHADACAVPSESNIVQQMRVREQKVDPHSLNDSSSSRGEMLTDAVVRPYSTLVINQMIRRALKEGVDFALYITKQRMMIAEAKTKGNSILRRFRDWRRSTSARMINIDKTEKLLNIPIPKAPSLRTRQLLLQKVKQWRGRPRTLRVDIRPCCRGCIILRGDSPWDRCFHTTNERIHDFIRTLDMSASPSVGSTRLLQL